MDNIKKNIYLTFAAWGKTGGKKRAQKLSSKERSQIASHASKIRWEKTNKTSKIYKSIRLNEVIWDDPVYLEEILSEGSLDSWRELYSRLANHPFGKTAQALYKVVSFTHIYGATLLWAEILKILQGKII